MKTFAKLVGGICCVVSIGSFAATGTVRAKITDLMVHDDSRFGGCMALLTANPSGQGLNCPLGANWVTFSCNGDLLPKDTAKRLFESIQLAAVLDQEVFIVVDDSKKANGWCLGVRVDIKGLQDP